MAPLSLSLPPWVDVLDDRLDAAWEPLRRQPALDRLFYAASAAGDFSAVWHVANLVRTVQRRQTPRQAVVFAVAVGVESLIVNQGIKRLFDRDRPVDDRGRAHHLRTPSTSSFPSGHASSGAFATVVLRRRGKVSPVIAAAAAVVATSRLHVRIHHASDVVAGAAVGIGLGAVARRLVR